MTPYIIHIIYIQTYVYILRNIFFITMKNSIYLQFAWTTLVHYRRYVLQPQMETHVNARLGIQMLQTVVQ